MIMQISCDDLGESCSIVFEIQANLTQDRARILHVILQDFTKILANFLVGKPMPIMHAYIKYHIVTHII